LRWNPEPRCSAKDPCEQVRIHGRHLKGVRSHPGMEGVKGTKTTTDLEEKYRIPEALIRSILEQDSD
jgi:hypothetical protein